MSLVELIENNNKYYSHFGKITMERIAYLLDRKSYVDKILAGKNKSSFVKDFISQEEKAEFLDLQNDTDYDNIFSENYQERHNLDKLEQKLKYFSNVKNPCTHIENRVKNNIAEKKRKLKQKKIQIKEDIHKLIAKEELQKILDSGFNFNYYHHLLHHTGSARYYIENNKDEFILGPDVNATRYNPKLEYVFRKTVYSPSFKLMHGRYDKEKLVEKLKKSLEEKIMKKNEENMEKTKNKLDNKIKIKKLYKQPKYNYEKSNEIKKSNSSNSFKANGSETNDNNTKENDKSGTNNNETVFTSNVLKNVNYNESNTIHSNANFNINNNIILNNEYLTVRLSNYLQGIKNKKHFRKINLINKNKFPTLFRGKQTHASSVTNIFQNDNKIFNKNNKNISTLNKTSNSNNSDLYIFPTTEKATNSTNCKPNSKKNKDNSYTIKAPNFNKMLGRNYLSKLNFQEEPIHPALNPNWSSVKPKCIMKVIYSHRPVQKKIINKFQGMGDEATFDINKVFYKYNDHIEPKTVNFDKMMGRSNNKEGIESNFPSFMTNLANRNSCVNFNEKSLIMNNFCEGRLKDQISSFNQQKCFNIKLKENNEINLNNNSFERNNENDASKIFGKIFGSNSTKSRKKKISIPKQDFMAISYKSGLLDGLPEFYRINLDSIKNKNKIDGITFKSYYDSSKDILSNREKKVFLIDFNKMK